MLRKLFAGGLLLVVGFGLLLGGRVSSQDKVDLNKDGKGLVPLSADDGKGGTPLSDIALDRLVEELKNVRSQKAELDRREQQLMEAIEIKINMERQQLDHKVQVRRAQLEEIERLIHGDVKFKRMKAMPKEEFKKEAPKDYFKK
jgi:hypothetical protein